MKNYKKIVCRTIFDILFFYRRVTTATPYLQPRLESELVRVRRKMTSVEGNNSIRQFIKKSDYRRSSSPTSVGSLTGLNSFKAV